MKDNVLSNKNTDFRKNEGRNQFFCTFVVIMVINRNVMTIQELKLEMWNYTQKIVMNIVIVFNVVFEKLLLIIKLLTQFSTRQL